MLIEIDSSEAKRLGININQLIVLKALREKESLDLKSLLEVNPFSENDFNDLMQKNLISTSSKYKVSSISEVSLFGEGDECREQDRFEEFYKEYPVSVKRPDGTKDFLRGDKARCRKIYMKTIGLSDAKHQKILNALKNEVADKKMDGKLPYMKRMSKWLAAEDWLLADEIELDNRPIQKERAYGTEVE